MAPKSTSKFPKFALALPSKASTALFASTLLSIVALSLLVYLVFFKPETKKAATAAAPPDAPAAKPAATTDAASSASVDGGMFLTEAEMQDVETSW